MRRFRFGMYDIWKSSLGFYVLETRAGLALE